ncbi:MAG: MurT ligase domain-containing protein [Culicoidibacterales bacterium]
MKTLAIIAGKSAGYIGNKLGRGSSLPGMIARKIDRDLFHKIKLPQQTIVVTGTNGKTTTANMLRHVFETAGLSVVQNTKGANLLSGLLTTLIDATNLNGKVNADVVVLEVDEQTIPQFFKSVTPTHFVIHNFFRDQLDRYGEIDILIDKIEEVIDSKTKLVLNADDPLVYQIAFDTHRDALYYGVEQTKYSVLEMNQVREAKFCPNCNKKLVYDFFHYSQLGGYDCTCGFKKPVCQYSAHDVDLKKGTFIVAGTTYTIQYRNLYFIFNAMAVVAIAKEYGIDDETIQKGLSTFKIDDGRMETFTFGTHELLLNLVKNPTGVNQTLDFIKNEADERVAFMMTLNNLSADGQDTSWIWDADFEQLTQFPLEKFICSGIRAYDLAVRLKYAGIDEDKIMVIEDVAQALATLKETTSQPYLLSTYTALQKTRALLK